MKLFSGYFYLTIFFVFSSFSSPFCTTTTTNNNNNNHNNNHNNNNHNNNNNTITEISILMMKIWRQDPSLISLKWSFPFFSFLPFPPSLPFSLLSPSSLLSSFPLPFPLLFPSHSSSSRICILTLSILWCWIPVVTLLVTENVMALILKDVHVCCS